MISSMTAFASETATSGPVSFVMEMRGVNSKGLDIRLRLPERMSALEPKIRARLAKAFARGSISLNLRLEAGAGQGAVRLDMDAVDAYLNAAIQIRKEAREKGIKLETSTATDYLALRGIMVNDEDGARDVPEAAVMESLERAIAAFAEMRKSEGAALQAGLGAQIDEVESLVGQAQELAAERRDEVAATLKTNLARVLDNSDGADADRVAQELAMLAVKADITEELDRLSAHVDAARGLIDGDGPVGRKLDFLMQEFNREANTLCSKSGSVALTQVGLDMKLLIDQMREQVQNVE
jgi:uncharacterized protein (TIGR00255 family)